MSPHQRRRRAVFATVATAASAAALLAATLSPGAAAAAPPVDVPATPPADPKEQARPEPEPPPRLPAPKGNGKIKLDKSSPFDQLEADASAAAAAQGDAVALRPLVIATDDDDFGLPTWQTVLDRIGTPYDVLHARQDALDPADLVDPDGVGRYNAILLTNNALLYQDDSGNYLSALDGTEWNTLWAYERDYDVRQVSLYTGYGTFPEDYCLRPGSEGGVGTPGITAALTPAATDVFASLKESAQIPISESYVYRSTLQPGCDADPLLTNGSDVLGVVSTSPDGRERAALTFTSNQYLPQADLLTYGLVNWASKGVLRGELRHWINVDEDDWFNYSDHLREDGTVDDDPGFRLSGPEVRRIQRQQTSFRNRYPLAGDFTLNLAYNAGDFNQQAHALCTSLLTPDPLSSFSRCLRSHFRWVNHTLSHPEMNFTSYAESLSEIQENLDIARAAGFTVPTEVLKTGEYSGLGVYNPDPTAPDTDPPTDFGLMGSNPDLLAAAKDAGVKYLHGNMSFESHRPDCFNCGIYHPMEPELMVVPDWPTNIGYHVTNPAEQTLLFNMLYGPNGAFPFFDHDLSYAEIVDYESGVALQHVMSGSAYSHTLHFPNLHQYASGSSLTFDWLDAILDKYTSYYEVPLKNPDWPALAEYVESRNAHFDPSWAKLVRISGAGFDRFQRGVDIGG